MAVGLTIASAVSRLDMGIRVVSVSALGFLLTPTGIISNDFVCCLFKGGIRQPTASSLGTRGATGWWSIGSVHCHWRIQLVRGSFVPGPVGGLSLKCKPDSQYFLSYTKDLQVLLTLLPHQFTSNHSGV